MEAVPEGPARPGDLLATSATSTDGKSVPIDPRLFGFPTNAGGSAAQSAGFIPYAYHAYQMYPPGTFPPVLTLHPPQQEFLPPI